jgi:hypothetical protein
MCAGLPGWEFRWQVVSPLSKLVASVWEGICSHFDGHIPGGGPVATCLDLSCWICASKRDLCSDAANILLRRGNRVVHDSHFWAIFNLIFNLIFQEWTSEWDKNELKNGSFLKNWTLPSLLQKWPFSHSFSLSIFIILSNSAPTCNPLQWLPPSTTTPLPHTSTTTTTPSPPAITPPTPIPTSTNTTNRCKPTTSGPR